jgi:septum formation protein
LHSFIYLASASPRRRELLAQIGVEFRMLLAAPNEDVEGLEVPEKNESARHYVMRVTALKAGAALMRLRSRKLVDAPLLVADTTVSIEGMLLGKPRDGKDATRMLQRLSGRTHRVLTAVAVAYRRRLDFALSESRVTMAVLDAATLAHYLESGEAFGKAGAYAIQGRAAAFITRISGSHSGIVGLPLAETAQLLKSFDVKF